MTKKEFSRIASVTLCISVLIFPIACTPGKIEEKPPPNFLILMSDNHSWSHLGCYGNPVVNTPNIDKISEQGIRFTNAFCSSPSCTPARASMLTGQDIWRLEEGANLWGTLPSKFVVYPDILEEYGYLVGCEGKGWGPGDYEAGGRVRNPGGNSFNSFEEFYNQREKGQPFMYWFSSRNPHRPYRENGGQNANIDLSEIEVPDYLPDTEEVRSDIADYYDEVQHFDSEVAGYISLLKEVGQLDHTIVIVCSDNGWQMPRGLANLYDMGTKIPLVISMPERFKPGRVVDDFVSLSDFAPTILELAGAPIPDGMTAKSLVNILESEQSGVIEPERDFVITARERHAYVRKNGAGYGGRAIQTRDFLYIINFEHENWPAGDPPLFGDVDAHMLHYPCATKLYLLENYADENVKPLFNLAFEMRPAEELYDLKKDPHQMNNVADDSNYREAKSEMKKRLIRYLTDTKDPRVVGGEMKWMNAAYFKEIDKTPRPGQRAIDALGLEKEYYYDR